MYQHYTVGAPAPVELTTWSLAERFGWTIEYIQSLPLATIHELYQVDDGRMKAGKSILPKRGGNV